MAVCQNLVPLVNIKIAGKWMFIPLKMVLIGIDPYPCIADTWYNGEKQRHPLCARIPASHLHGRGRGLTCLTGNPIGSALEDHGRPVDIWTARSRDRTKHWNDPYKQMMFQISSQLPRFSKELRQLQCSSNHLGFAQKWVTKGPIKIESVFVLNHIKTCFFFLFSGYDNILNHFKHYQPPRKDGHTNHYFSRVLLFNLFWGW